MQNFRGRILERFTGDLILQCLKHGIYPNLRYFERVSYSNNFIKCLYNRARSILMHNFLELGKICVLKVHRKIRAPVNRLRIRPQNRNYNNKENRKCE